MLHLLAKYATEAEPGFAAKEVRWAIVFDAQARFLQVIELGDVDAKRNRGRMFPRCPDLSQPELVGGSETRCHFLVESADVVASYVRENADEKTVKRARDKHTCFVKLLCQVSSAAPVLGSIAEALDDPVTLESVQARLREGKAKPTDKVTLAIDDRTPHFLVEWDSWHDWWREFRRKLKSSSPARAAPQMRCFITGEFVEPCATHPKIKGLADVGGLPTGDVVIGFDKEAFSSYGLKQSANAAMSEEAASRYCSALNELIREHGRRLANAKVVHWFKEKVAPDEDPLSWLEEPADQQERNAQQRAKELLESIRTGIRPDLQDNHFYALTISGQAGRVMVRDWMEGQFQALVENINAWFNNLSICRRDGTGLANPPKFLAVLGATVRDLDDLVPPFVSKMWRVAVGREPIPLQALAQALSRARVDVIGDQPPNHARMGLIKAYHIRKKGDAAMSPYLNEDHPEVAYQCGRLMAVLAAVQRRALGDIGAGVIQRFYAAASSTPALVLGRLTRTSQFHLNKLEPGLARWHEARISDIWSRIKDRPPKTLSLEEQSLFALGYYQQMAADRAKASTNSNA